MIDISLTEAQQQLPEITDQASAGESFVITKQGKPMAIVLSIDEYVRLKEAERLQDAKEWEILLNLPDTSGFNEEEAIELAVSEVRAYRVEKRAIEEQEAIE